MQRQRKTNLILLFLVLLLGLLVQLSPTPPRGPASTPLTTVDPTSISRIELSNRHTPRLVLTRSDQGWQMVEPYVAEADPSQVERLLRMLSTRWIERFAAPPGRLAEFGLAPSRAELRFDGIRIRFGGTHPLNQHRYLQIDGQIHLTKDLFPHLVQAAPEAFVIKADGASN